MPLNAHLCYYHSRSPILFGRRLAGQPALMIYLSGKIEICIHILPEDNDDGRIQLSVSKLCLLLFLLLTLFIGFVLGCL
jgi:hypothetical protein